MIPRVLAPLYRRVTGMIAKALIESLSDSGDLQLVKLTTNGEAHDDVERVQPYGLTSSPDAGAQAIVVFVGGDRSNPLVIACDDGRVRVKTSPGEVALYSKFGNKIVMKADGSIEATPASGKPFKVNGTIIGTDVWAGTVGAYVKLFGHIHPAPGGATSVSTPAP